MSRTLGLVVAFVALSWAAPVPEITVETTHVEASHVDLAHEPINESLTVGEDFPLNEENIGRLLQEATKPASTAAPKKEGFSMWGIATRFFAVREKTIAKHVPTASAGAGAAPAAATTKSTMPKDIGIGFKNMLEWHCKKPENSGKVPLCLKVAGVPGSTSLASKPPMGDSVAAVKAYCSVADNKSKPLCVWAKLSSHKTPAAKPAAVSQSAVQRAAPVAAPTGAGKKPKMSPEKRAAKKASKTAKMQ